MDFPSPIQTADQMAFSFINSTLTNDVFDIVFPAITDLHKNPIALAIMLLLIGFWIWKKRRAAVAGAVCLLLSVGLSDLISYRVIKTAVDRPRPAEIGLNVQLRTHRHSGSSFPSNHAANVFAAATSLSVFFPTMTWLWYLIASLVGISRIYVGVHFPLDVVAGAVLGSLIAVTVLKLIWHHPRVTLWRIAKRN